MESMQRLGHADAAARAFQAAAVYADADGSGSGGSGSDSGYAAASESYSGSGSGGDGWASPDGNGSDGGAAWGAQRELLEGSWQSDGEGGGVAVAAPPRPAVVQELSLDLDSWQQVGFPPAVLASVVACKNGVKRAHLIDAESDGCAAHVGAWRLGSSAQPALALLPAVPWHTPWRLLRWPPLFPRSSHPQIGRAHV